MPPQTTKNFSRILITRVQRRFEVLEDDGNSQALERFCCIIGQLFLGGLFSFKVVASAVRALLHLDDGAWQFLASPPPPYKIHCVRALLRETGEVLGVGRYFSLLKVLGTGRDRQDIADLLALRARGWKSGGGLVERRAGILFWTSSSLWWWVVVGEVVRSKIVE